MFICNLNANKEFMNLNALSSTPLQTIASFILI